MKQLVYLIIITISFSCASKKLTTSSQLKLNELEFQSIFGTKDKNESKIYSLLGSGYFLTPRSDDSDSLISNWISLHPNADVTPVSSHGPTITSDQNSRMIYVILVDEGDTLNNYLIKLGCFPGGTMMYNSIKEMEIGEEFKDLFDKEEHFEEFFITGKSYENYISQLKVAEQYARDNKLGIWADDFNGRRR